MEELRWTRVLNDEDGRAEQIPDGAGEPPNGLMLVRFGVLPTQVVGVRFAPHMPAVFFWASAISRLTTGEVRSGWVEAGDGATFLPRHFGHLFDHAYPLWLDPRPPADWYLEYLILNTEPAYVTAVSADPADASIGDIPLVDPNAVDWSAVKVVAVTPAG